MNSNKSCVDFNGDFFIRITGLLLLNFYGNFDVNLFLYKFQWECCGPDYRHLMYWDPHFSVYGKFSGNFFGNPQFLWEFLQELL